MLFQTSPEHEELRAKIRTFAEEEIKPIAFMLDQQNEFPGDAIRKLGEMGWMGIPFPKEYGGAGLDALSYAIAVEELSRVDGGAGVILSAHVSLGSWPIFAFGTEEQKQKYLAPLARGEKIGAFGLTEPNAGSDAGGVQTTAVEDGDEWVINGTKCFISNGPIAGIYTVLASTNKKAGAMGLTAFIVERDRPGVSIGKEEDKMGMRLSCTSEVIFDNVRIPKDHMLGRKNRGFKIILETLDHSRAGVGAFGVGIGQRCVEEAAKYAKQRKQFGVSVSTFQSVQNMLADMEIHVQAARQAYLHAAELMDAGLPFTMEAAIAKTIGTDTGMKCAVDGVQVMGGYGYMKDYPMEKLMRDAKILQIYEGTNQIQRSVVAGQLLKKYH